MISVYMPTFIINSVLPHTLIAHGYMPSVLTVRSAMSNESCLPHGFPRLEEAFKKTVTKKPDKILLELASLPPSPSSPVLFAACTLLLRLTAFPKTPKYTSTFPPCDQHSHRRKVGYWIIPWQMPLVRTILLQCPRAYRILRDC